MRYFPAACCICLSCWGVTSHAQDYTLVTGSARASGEIDGAFIGFYDTTVPPGVQEVHGEVGSYWWPDWSWSQGKWSTANNETYADVRSHVAGTFAGVHDGNSWAQGSSSQQSTKNAGGATKVWFYFGVTAPGSLGVAYDTAPRPISKSRIDVGPDTWEGQQFYNQFNNPRWNIWIKKNAVTILWLPGPNVDNVNAHKILGYAGPTVAAGTTVSSESVSYMHSIGQMSRASIMALAAIANN